MIFASVIPIPLCHFGCFMDMMDFMDFMDMMDVVDLFDAFLPLGNPSGRSVLCGELLSSFASWVFPYFCFCFVTWSCYKTQGTN